MKVYNRKNTYIIRFIGLFLKKLANFSFVCKIDWNWKKNKKQLKIFFCESIRSNTKSSFWVFLRYIKVCRSLFAINLKLNEIWCLNRPKHLHLSPYTSQWTRIKSKRNSQCGIRARWIRIAALQPDWRNGYQGISIACKYIAPPNDSYLY